MIRSDSAFRRGLLVGPGLLLLLVGVLLGGCGREGRQRVQGYVEGEFVYIASPLAGALESLQVQRGLMVKAGDPLFVLEHTSEKAALERARAAAALSEKEFARQVLLSGVRGANAVQDLDRARSARDQDAQRLIQAEWDLSQKSQAAPQAGLVFDTLYRQGEWVAAGHPVAVLLPPQNIKVRAFVSETLVGRLHRGDHVQVSVDGVKKPFAGRVSYISSQAEYTPPVIYSRQSRGKLVFMIEAVFDPDVAAKLHPGQPVDVQLMF